MSADRAEEDCAISRPRLVSIPSSDKRFNAHANALLDVLVAKGSRSCLPGELQRQLRASFPGSVVRPQDPLGQDPLGELAPHGGAEPVWYVTNRAYRSRIDIALELPVPRPVVFDVYAHRVREWQSAVRLRPGRLEPDLVGSEWEASWQILGQTIEGMLRLVDADAPHSLRFEAAGGGVRVWYDTSFVATDHGTLLRVAGDYDLPAGLLGRLADRLVVERIVLGQIDGAHAHLATLCTVTYQAIAQPAAAETA